MIYFQGYPSCPFCRAAVGFASIDARRPFRCPHCGETITLTRSYGRALFFISVAFSVAILATFGIRGLVLAIGSAVICFPIMIGMSPLLNKTTLFRLVVPPQNADCNEMGR